MPSPTKHLLAGYERQRPFSLRYKLRALLYLGVTLLSRGLGMLIYQNIGYGVIVANMAGLTAIYLGYAAWHWPTFIKAWPPTRACRP